MKDRFKKNSVLAILIYSLLFSFMAGCEKEPVYKNGDLIFQTSNSLQSKVIQLATHSPYSHVGIIYIQNKRPFVYEAVEPVQLIALEQWIKRGKGRHFVVKRLKNAQKILTPGVLKKMFLVAEKYRGKHYDWYFGWADDVIYCSELVWKIYKQGANFELAPLRRLRDFDLKQPLVQAELRKRYGKSVPLNEAVISPADLFNSSLLRTVKSN